MLCPWNLVGFTSWLPSVFASIGKRYAPKSEPNDASVGCGIPEAKFRRRAGSQLDKGSRDTGGHLQSAEPCPKPQLAAQ